MERASSKLLTRASQSNMTTTIVIGADRKEHCACNHGSIHAYILLLIYTPLTSNQEPSGTYIYMQQADTLLLVLFPDRAMSTDCKEPTANS